MAPSLRLRPFALPAALVALTAALLGACGGAKEGSTATTASILTVNGDVPVAFVQRSTALNINPTGGAPTAPGGDLMVADRSSASAQVHNLTAAFTKGAGDASDPEVSYDGKHIVFAMRCPANNGATIDGQPACTGRWNIWEYDMSAGGLTGGTFRRITASTESDDVDPAYLPAGNGFVFSSNRQTQSSVNQALGRSYYALDEYERERVFNLHTMTDKGEKITQISFNASHDRNPVVRPNGDILFSRWEHVADKNRFAIFRVKPDGTDMFVLYGAQSSGNSFLHPRDMDPKGKYAGQLATSLMPLQRTQEGGALMIVDAANYSEENTPASTSVAAVGGQQQFTSPALSTERGLSPLGRITTPYPLWDGTDRILMASRPCEVTRDGVVVPCATLSADELKTLQSERSTIQAAAASVKDNAPAAYAIVMYDPANSNWSIVAAPPRGSMFTDPIALQARSEPNNIPPTALDADLKAQGLAQIEVRSVYDTDGLQRMGERMIAPSDLPEGCTKGIAMTTPPADGVETRSEVADLVKLKDPAQAAYHCTPVRWVRAVRAIPPPVGMSGLRGAIGETNFEQQQILGYAPVEPDGSFKLQVPADTPLLLAIVDREGRAFQTHTNWIQARPGERRTCDGCHSPRRGASLNSGAVVNSVPAAWLADKQAAHQSGQTMAALRASLDATVMRLSNDPVYSDPWADTAQANVKARASISLRYTGNPNPADDLATPAPVNGVINYPEHIQPLWQRDRGAGTCTNCHTEAARINLLGTVAGSGRLVSYEELLVGDPEIDPATGLPKTHLEDGVPMIDRLPPLVETSSGAQNAAGQARKSRLMEILSGQNLLAPQATRDIYPGAPDGVVPKHATLLNAAEKRLLAEWMDLGGQYYNNPFTATGVRSITGLSETVFTQQVFPLLRSTCANGCHQAIGSDQQVRPGVNFRENRFVLTGDAEGDYGSTLSMVTDTCNASASALLRRPSTLPHPAGALTQTTAVLPAGSSAFNTLAAWISSGCTP
ncbi:hypothetical protein BurJ1DRAFT_1750 [Burkholderiales bacterium JOSHI_001]|nr:hypothetical protein BurJ1DRAFT_1750 [Burkholderiales bacterium JOSHI_001]